MTKKAVLIAAIGALLAVGAFGVTVSAAGDGVTVQQMWDACRSGDWQGMWDAMRGLGASGTIPYVPADGSGGCGVGGCGGGATAGGVLF